MGCSCELISLISQISSLANQMQSQDPSCLAENFETAASLLDQIVSLRQDPGHFSDNVESMLHIAEVKRLSALLYFHNRIVPLLQPSMFALPDLPPIAELQESIISYLRALPSSSGAALWPLFVLWKSRLTDMEQVSFVLERLQQLETSRFLGNVYHVRRRIERDIWAKASKIGQGDQEGVRDLASSRAICETERWISLA